MHDDRIRLRHLAIFLLLAVPLAPPARAADRPNILWITSEDNSPYLGCYGDPLARTPNLDRLAAQGVRYRNAFANAPVCSSARTTLITGMYASSLGVHNHRSRVAIPDGFRLYPEIL
ncbi:MAG TPA: sulfatase-like hydrolase/transferase, partial [Candidatus Paceibacterota bacterium]|nr:sulfatase-like hydrolase/transferase [Candidatus Paceibacterota bacterium]